MKKNELKKVEFERWFESKYPNLNLNLMYKDIYNYYEVNENQIKFDEVSLYKLEHEERYICNSKSLNDCYKKPSYNKECAYNKCMNRIFDIYYKRSCLDCCGGVTSYNSNFFTFESYIKVTPSIYVFIRETYLNIYITIMYTKEKNDD